MIKPLKPVTTYNDKNVYNSSEVGDRVAELIVAVNSLLSPVGPGPQGREYYDPKVGTIYVETLSPEVVKINEIIDCINAMLGTHIGLLENEK